MSVLDPSPILGPDGAIARRLPHYEVREEQLAMSRAVATAIERPGHLVVEAGTGVGKSFAYLVPAILAATEQKKKVIVSTHTIALQEQLLSKDIPFLRSVMPQEFSAVLVKGRSNYHSLRRLKVAVERQESTFNQPDDRDQLAVIRSWSGRTRDGSLSDLGFRPSTNVWEAVQSENGNCLGRECQFSKECFYYRARRRMWTANILVVNHALYFSDLALRGSGFGLLPEHDVVIFDEAHTLESVAGEHLGIRLSSVGIDFALARLYNDRNRKGLLAYHRLDEAIQQVRRAREASADFFERVIWWQLRQGASHNGRIREPAGWPEHLCEELRKLSTAISKGAESVENPEHHVELIAASDRCASLALSLDTWVHQKRPDSVYWIERDEGPRRRVRLACAPLDISSTLRTQLFEQVDTCVMTSATLCVGSPPRFDFYKSRVGLTSTDELALGSPFDYQRQVTIHLPRNSPDPSEHTEAYQRWATRAIAHYLEKTGGKAFVLFTSNRMLESTARALTHWFARRNIALFAQTDGMPRTKMVEAFKSDVNSVIFGADTFWQGVDVPGEALSNVIIVRLPFSVPSHPLLEARLESIRKRGGNPFVEYQIPEAVIKLKQGFGRLIRTRTDRGIVVILDPRILSKPYGRIFLNSLPACPRSVETIDLPTQLD
jgi:ATP-dependent DNA helicase DinG